MPHSGNTAGLTFTLMSANRKQAWHSACAIKWMMEPENVLIAIDDFPMTEHLRECIEPFVRNHPTATAHLFHALGPLPPQLLESPGAEDPIEEEKLEAR